MKNWEAPTPIHNDLWAALARTAMLGAFPSSQSWMVLTGRLTTSKYGAARPSSIVTSGLICFQNPSENSQGAYKF